MSGDILTVKTVKRVRSVRGSALVHFGPGIGFQNPPSYPNILYPAFERIRALIFGVKMGLSNQNQDKQNRPHF